MFLQNGQSTSKTESPLRPFGESIGRFWRVHFLSGKIVQENCGFPPCIYNADRLVVFRGLHPCLHGSACVLFQMNSCGLLVEDLRSSIFRCLDDRFPARPSRRSFSAPQIEEGRKIAENRALTDVNRRCSGLMPDFLQLIDVNAGGLRPKTAREFKIQFSVRRC